MLSFYQAWFRIGETLVRESKQHITAEEACDRIRNILQQTEKPERNYGLYGQEHTFPDCPANCEFFKEETCEKADYCI